MKNSRVMRTDVFNATIPDNFRKRVVDGVSTFYENMDETMFMFQCWSASFDLLAFDEWLDHLPSEQGELKRLMIEWRFRALQAWLNENWDAFWGWINALYVNWQGDRVFQELRPQAEALQKGREMGRIKGAKSQKDYAAETWRMAHKIDLDLLKHADTARWDLDQRAKYISDILKNLGRHQPNGKPYAISTIKNRIQGKAV